MKTIILIENENNNFEPIADILRQTPGDFNLLFANDERTAYILAGQENIDLIIYDCSSLVSKRINSLERLSLKLPYIPCLVILDEEAKNSQDILATGIHSYITRPLKPEDLYHQVLRLLNISSNGYMRNIPVYSLLQMFENEQKTCTLKIRGKEDTGFVFMQKGVVVASETSSQTGDDAMYTILNWDECLAEIRYYNAQLKHTIQKPLLSLIIESQRLKDEGADLKPGLVRSTKQRPAFKHLSTTGNRLSIEIGAKLKMEIDGIDAQLVSSIVGMIPGTSLVITTPQPFSLVEKALNNGRRITIKYIHMGRLCMFESHLIRAIEEPFKVLFLEYPPVIHYNELRRAKRTVVFVPCTVHLLSGPEFYGVMVDLSNLGCLCQIKVKGNAPIPTLDLGTTIRLRCLLPGLKEDQELNGIVKNMTKNSTETKIGVEFLELPKHVKESIDRYVYSVESLSE